MLEMSSLNLCNLDHQEMYMAKTEHRINIAAPQNEVFQAITTADGLKGWYSPDVAGKSDKGGEVTLSFTEKEGPFRWKVTEADKGSLVRWECLAGPGQSAGTIATFRLASNNSGGTTVELDHEGFHESDAKLKTCNTLWGALMHHLKGFVETKQAKPAFQ